MEGSSEAGSTVVVDEQDLAAGGSVRTRGMKRKAAALSDDAGESSSSADDSASESEPASERGITTRRLTGETPSEKYASFAAMTKAEKKNLSKATLHVYRTLGKALAIDRTYLKTVGTVASAFKFARALIRRYEARSSRNKGARSKRVKQPPKKRARTTGKRKVTGAINVRSEMDRFRAMSETARKNSYGRGLLYMRRVVARAMEILSTLPRAWLMPLPRPRRFSPRPPTSRRMPRRASTRRARPRRARRLSAVFETP
jgi:hypothetical protein